MPEPFEPPRGVRVVYSDLDGTMLGRGASFVHDPSGAPTLEPAGALLAAAEAGIEIVVCSGRAMPGVAGDARILGLATAIGEMGAVVSYRGGRDLELNLGEYPGGDEPPVTFMEAAGAVRVLTERFRLEHHTPWSASRTYTHLLRGSVDPGEANAALAEAGLGWCVLADNGVLHGAYLGLDAGTARAYHLTPRGVSKGSAIALDRARRGFAREECIAIGDAVADLAMAGEVGLVVLTSDALADDAALAAAAAGVANARATTRPGNLGWADAIAGIAARR